MPDLVVLFGGGGIHLHFIIFKAGPTRLCYLIVVPHLDHVYFGGPWDVPWLHHFGRVEPTIISIKIHLADFSYLRLLPNDVITVGP